MIARTAICLPWLLGLLAIPALAQDGSIELGKAEVPAVFSEILASRAAECASFDGGKLTIEEGALARADLDGDGTPDWVLDELHLSCSTAASLLCGTGGCNVNFLIGDTLTTRLAKGWEVVGFPPLRVLLVQVHGVRCGGINLNPCVEAMVWDPTEKRYFTLATDG